MGQVRLRDGGSDTWMGAFVPLDGDPMVINRGPVFNHISFVASLRAF